VAKPLAVVPDLDAELDELYGLAPSEFTEARNDLARRLKEAGQTEAAAKVKGLRKPTVPIWIVNQLARRHPEDVEALLEAGRLLRSAQETTLAGGDPQELRSATAAERGALRTLTQRAQKVLAAEGHGSGAAALERVASTLRGAAVDPGRGELLARGRLNEELDSAGFDALAGMPVRAQPSRSRPNAKPAPPAVDPRLQNRIRKLRERVKQLEDSAAEAGRAADSAQAEAEGARKKAERARAAVEDARAKLEAAEEAAK
jgi:hypothetical protein